jgi:ATP-dependent RNA helicase DDX51/DBP6
VVWRETAGGASSAHDVCICAPTGSGKTLAYALPVLQALAGRRLPLLRALAVLPTRDLAAQVFGVLRALCPALGLTACLAAGKAGLAAEAELLAAGGVGAPCKPCMFPGTFPACLKPVASLS